MPFVATFMQNGRVASSEGILYTAPALTTAYIKLVKFSNTAVGTESLIVYVRKGAGTSRIFYKFALGDNEFATIDDPIVLNAGDTLRAQTTTTTTVDFIVMGVEES